MAKQYELVQDYCTPRFNYKKGTQIAILFGGYVVGAETYTIAQMDSMPEWFKEIKPIEDKEPTAFQWSDKLVQEYGDLRTNGHYYKNLTAKEFKSVNQLSQSIKCGTGTANETINEKRVWGVDINWEIKSHPEHLGHVMKAEDCRFVEDSEQKCIDFIKKYKPTPTANDVSKGYDLRKVWEESMNSEKLYTEDDLKVAFDNAHLMKGDRYVYNTFEDYKNKNL